jgi:ketosteroid isomerase-like protein
MAQAMSERNVEIVRTLHRAFDEIGMEVIRDALSEGGGMRETAAAIGSLGQMVVDFVDPDIEVELVASAFSLPDMPSGTRLRGWDGWTAFWRGWLDPWDEFEFRLRDVVDAGDHVILDIAISASGRGSGAPVDVTLSQVWTVRDERVTRLVIFDTRAEAEAAAEAIADAEV